MGYAKGIDEAAAKSEAMRKGQTCPACGCPHPPPFPELEVVDEGGGAAALVGMVLALVAVGLFALTVIGAVEVVTWVR